MRLSNFRSIFTHKITQILFAVIAIFFAVAAINILFFSGKTVLPEEKLPSLNEQPITDNKFDESAPISQFSKTSIESIRDKLPYRSTIKTISGNQSTFVLIYKPRDPYTLYVETLNINFQSDHTDPELAKNVQDFRDTAAEILSWLEKQNIDTSQLFISWGSQAYVQQNAEAWLEVSDAFPKVINKDSKLVFETEPQIP